MFLGLGIALGIGLSLTTLLIMSAVNRDLGERNVRLHLAEVKGPVQDRLLNSPLWTALSGDVFLSVNEAFETLGRLGPAAKAPQRDVSCT